MKKVYIGHSREYDYQSELYNPVRQCVQLSDQEIILPHEVGYHNQQNRDFYRDLDLFIAEVSYPATGLGIELGWAYDSKVPIVCIHKESCQPSGSLRVLTDQFYTYETPDELVRLIQKFVSKLN